MLKEPVKKRRHLTRFLTSLVSATLFHRLLKDRASGSVAMEHFMFLTASGNVN
jgi:hypothetical protein